MIPGFLYRCRFSFVFGFCNLQAAVAEPGFQRVEKSRQDLRNTRNGIVSCLCVVATLLQLSFFSCAKLYV
ncbi:hypothetical protein L6452_04570 [Arctium lappa]|uniref:Uncharacterized protein n=1 Tax=Arctium lappa TaxID=4217 RepID=A0ACB9EDZ6_ARCLA|nr:hypothetical protein L6452_04570 [Arctium lappa]